MTLFLTLLPVYLFGNLHCLGMCGPLVFFLGKHPYKYYYFMGRMISYSLAGLLAGALGSVLNVFLQQYHLSASISFLFGSILILTGSQMAFGRGIKLNFFNQKAGNMFSQLLLKEEPFPAFLFGFLTVFLPCGQTLVVFSACALSQDPLTGFFNGLAFALFTSPSLYLAMDAKGFLQKLKKKGNLLVGLCAMAAGVLAVLRGLADLDFISHLVISPEWHLVLY